jgi:hypothetical protein
MRRAIVKSRVSLGLISVVVLSVATPVLRAQQAAVAPPADAARSQVEAFEGSLKNAIDAAARKLSARVREAFPGQDIALQYQAQPVVTGIILSEVGPVFHVLIPAIEDLSLKIFAMNARRPSPAQRVGDSNGRVTAAGVVPDDPAVPLLTNPDQEYTTLVREALINAVLDQAMALPIPPTQHLTVVAGELPTQPLSPFDQRSRMLILQLKGEDLIALREHRIDRDEARSRIKESKFPN